MKVRVSTSPRRMRLLAAVIAAVVALAAVPLASWAAGLYSASSPAPVRTNQPVAYAPIGAPMSGELSGIAPADALARVVARMDSNMFATVSIGKPPTADDWQGNWLYATINVDSLTNAAYLPELWEADLLQGALAESMNAGQRDLANVVVGSTFTARLPDGSEATLGGGAGDVAAYQEFAAPTDDNAVAQAQTVLSKFGLATIDVRVLHPLDSALYVVAQVKDVNTLANQLNVLQNDLLGSPLEFEGLYLEIRDSSGQPIVRSASAFRSGAGHIWAKPDLGVDLGVSSAGAPAR